MSDKENILKQGVANLCDVQGIEGYLLLYTGEDNKIKMVGNLDPAFIMKAVGPSLLKHIMK